MLAVAQQDRIDVFADHDGQELFVRIVQTDSIGQESVVFVTRAMLPASIDAIKAVSKDF